MNTREYENKNESNHRNEIYNRNDEAEDLRRNQLDRVRALARLC